MQEVIGAKAKEMEPAKGEIIVGTCIDFRFLEEEEKTLSEEGLEEGQYRLLATAGAGRNDKFKERINKPEGTSIKELYNYPHEGCGFAIGAGDDSRETHHKYQQNLGEDLKAESPGIEYRTKLLTLPDEELEKYGHDCEATSIILGEPEMVKMAKEELRRQGLIGKSDIIARPFELSVEDESIWEDLSISLRLHHPKKVLVFEKDEANALALMKKIKEVAQNVEVEKVLINKAA